MSSKPSDLLPELQGRLPIRVELRALEKDDFVRILTETEASLIKQYIALMKTEGVELDFTDDAIDALAGIAVDLNASVENIGARRLQTVMERVLDEISFDAPDQQRHDASPSTPPMSRSMSATWRGTQICRDSSCKGAGQPAPVATLGNGATCGRMEASATSRRAGSIGRSARLGRSIP